MTSNAYQRRYHAIKNALTPAEKELINIYELEYHLAHRVPSIEEATASLRKKFPKVRQTSVNYYLNRQPVQKALKDRGIPFQQHTREDLTATQVAAAITVMNFADERPIGDKLDQLGINRSQYYAWQNDPQFQTLLRNLENQNLQNIRPTAIAEFTKKINQGDWNAIKYYLEATGTVKNDDAPQSEVLIRMLIEIIQRHVKDPEIIMAIAQDIKNVTSNRTIEAQEYQVLDSEPVDVVELENAKRQLGIG